MGKVEMAMYQLQQVHHVHSPGWFLVETQEKKKKDFENGGCLHFTFLHVAKKFTNAGLQHVEISNT